jgi:hypothetical protein
MKLTRRAIKNINNLETRLKLAMFFKVTERRISQMIKDNKNDGQFTTASALKLIRELTGLDDSQILEETKTEKSAA